MPPENLNLSVYHSGYTYVDISKKKKGIVGLIHPSCRGKTKNDSCEIVGNCILKSFFRKYSRPWITKILSSSLKQNSPKLVAQDVDQGE